MLANIYHSEKLIGQLRAKNQSFAQSTGEKKTFKIAGAFTYCKQTWFFIIQLTGLKIRILLAYGFKMFESINLKWLLFCAISNDEVCLECVIT